MKIIRWSFVSLILILMVSACSPQAEPIKSSPDQAVSSDDTPVPTDTPFPADAVRDENAMVEEMDLLIMESFPVQINVLIKGQLPDGCTQIEDTRAEKVDETTFEVTITTVRPADAMCTQALVPFEITTSLDVNGLPAGTYTVKVYDLSKEFTFEQDNILK